ncbi:MAG: nucleotide-binding universal stress UspA family protein [Planctomycetota bacterium]
MGDEFGFGTVASDSGAAHPSRGARLQDGSRRSCAVPVPSDTQTKTQGGQAGRKVGGGYRHSVPAFVRLRLCFDVDWAYVDLMVWPNRKSILVPIDFSDASFAALDEALTMVAEPSDVHAIHVLPSLDGELAFMRETFDVEGREVRAANAVRDRLGEGRLGVQVVVCTGVPGDVIASAAEELGCELIVISSHGRSGFSRFFLGSVAERVLRRAKCPVLVLRAQ